MSWIVPEKIELDHKVEMQTFEEIKNIIYVTGGVVAAVVLLKYLLNKTQSKKGKRRK
ncbi:MAG: hypothetical protein SFU98_16385 [Leptospiraceae bacterium]|nr:hypothetical protein [Leptospiraceae bacterium]